MRVNTTEFLTPDDQQHFETFADSLRASGARVRIHGLASLDGPAAYNLTLSCTRAMRAAELLHNRGVSSSQIAALIQHGEVPGSARENRSVVLEPIGATPGPGPTPSPMPVPTPTPTPPSTPPATPSCSIPTDCPSDFCTPYASRRLAIIDRELMAPILLAGIAAKISSRVVPLWYQYLFGGSPIQNFSSRFGSDFTDSATTADTTDFLVNELADDIESNRPVFPGGLNTVTIDISTRIGAAIREIGTAGGADEMNFDVIGEIPGNIAGGIGSSQASCPVGAQPSPINDTRTASGTVEVTRNPDGSLTVVPSITFIVRDTIDLCPGNCGADLEQIATVPMSRFEATGISGDVPFIVEFPAPPRTVSVGP
jgi:hypothetical protein